MAVTQNTYTGDGSTVLFSFTFPYLESTDIKVSVNGSNTTAYTLANATTIQFASAPANGAAIRIYRSTDDASVSSTFYPGSSIRSQDLNDNFTQGLYFAQEAGREASIAVTAANTAATNSATAIASSASAVSTANTALTNSQNAITQSSSAVTTANSASSSAASAVSTANSAASTAGTALTNSQTAITQSGNAVTTANQSSSTAATALTNSQTALTQSSSAVSTANSASSNANTALTNSQTALTQSATASTNATTAINTANTADTKANAAIAAVASSINYTPVANVAAIPGSPANNTYIEVTDSTGLESFTPLTGRPVGFVGDAGLTARIRYTTTGSTWVWLNYFANNSESRYLKTTGGTMTGKITLDGNPSSNLHAATKQYVDAADATLTSAAAAAQSTANTAVTNAAAAQSTANAALPKAGGTMTGDITLVGAPTANLHPATKAYVDTADATLTSAAAAAQSTANAALPKAGGTMTGNITFNAGQTFPTSGISAASTSAAGIVQLSDSTSSASSSTAATSAAVKSTYDYASIISTTANAAMPKSGGTFTGDITFGTTTSTTLPVGTTAQRPTGVAGMVRYNSTLGQFEGYTSAWGSLGGGATGGGSDTVFMENSNVVTTSYTLSNNKNAVSAGPITINNGATVTIPSGASWVVV